MQYLLFARLDAKVFEPLILSELFGSREKFWAKLLRVGRAPKLEDKASKNKLWILTLGFRGGLATVEESESFLARLCHQMLPKLVNDSRCQACLSGTSCWGISKITELGILTETHGILVATKDR